MPDLCAARRRARQPARAHLPHQGHAGERPAGERGCRPACRPLPLLPRLHDHLSVRRRLHAPRRSCPRTDRGDLPASARRPPVAFAARGHPALPRHASARRSRPASSRVRLPASSGRIPGMARFGAMLALAPTRLPARAMRDRPGSSRRKASGGDAWRCFAAAPSACSTPASTRRRSGSLPERRRSRAGQGRRRAVARWSITWDAQRNRTRRRATMSMPGLREIEGEGLDAIVITTSGCGTTIKDYGFMLRTDPEICREGGARLGARQGHHRISRGTRPRRAGALVAGSRSPTMPPARCSTVSRSGARRRRC